ncbi:NAD-binding protein [Rhizobium lusitanum]|uniref:NAD-binding protein n=2 Tax=Rhizobium lusitanum TaxID=293958 RepID=A0A6L9UDB4_9HYPH|nr:NAD(P)-dependent oxidoreductase [Rhizobium lusitanum]NEI72578.1 NAD-binding protein [Rhizobium lusitanum]
MTQASTQLEDVGLVTFIGAGVMGLPMVRNLKKGGVTVRVFDVREDVRNALEAEGIAVVATLAEAGAARGTVIAMLPDTPDVRSVVLGPNGLVETLPEGSLFVDMSTIAPAAERDMSERLEARNIAMVDAPVSGGVIGAVNGTLSIMVGGTDTAFAAARPILAHMGTTILHAGGIGSGQVFKMCNQLMVASHIQAMCEAFALARAHEVDLTLMSNALRGGAAGSWMLDNLGPKVIAKDGSAGFRIDLQLKDLKLANDAAFEKGVPLPGLAVATSLYLEARAHGEGSNGNQALFRTFDRLANQAER